MRRSASCSRPAALGVVLLSLAAGPLRKALVVQHGRLGRAGARRLLTVGLALTRRVLDRAAIWMLASG